MDNQVWILGLLWRRPLIRLQQGSAQIGGGRGLKLHSPARFCQDRSRLVRGYRTINQKIELPLAHFFRGKLPIHDGNRERVPVRGRLAGAFKQESSLRLVQPVGDDTGKKLLGRFVDGAKDVRADFGANAGFSQHRREGVGSLRVFRVQKGAESHRGISLPGFALRRQVTSGVAPRGSGG